MSRNVRTYDHFCLLARALEQVGDRWTLLVIRDLLSGPKRFTDLMDRLGGITPATLTKRLRELQDSGLLTADREPGRREVWYRLTPSGAELAPAIDALTWWGLQHAWRPPASGEVLHIEHLLRAITQAIGRTTTDREPARWLLRVPDGGDYVIESDGQHWSLTTASEPAHADVTVTADTTALTRFAGDPSPARAEELGIQISGSRRAISRFHRLLQAFPNVVEPPR